MIISVSSVSGSPGVTSWAMLLAAAWPERDQRQRIMLEADPDGGVVGARYGVGVEPGVVGLVASCRRIDALDVEPNARFLGGALWVVPSVESTEQLWPMWSSGAGELASRLAADDRVWLVDVGRLSPGSPMWPMASAAATNVLITRSEAEALLKLPARVDQLSECGAPTMLLVSGRMPHTVEELAEFAGPDEAALIPQCDRLPALVAKFLGGARSRRHIVWRTAVDLASQLESMTSVANEVDGTIEALL